MKGPRAIWVAYKGRQPAWGDRAAQGKALLENKLVDFTAYSDIFAVVAAEPILVGFVEALRSR
jgi:hypothetical protein